VTLVDVIRESGPVTVAAFMDLALYDPRFGYYARAARRSGRAGDFFTSVDVGALFGELLEIQLAEMDQLLRLRSGDSGIDLVEAGAGDGRLSADILRAAQSRHPELYDRLRVHLVEASPAAREAQRATLGGSVDRLRDSTDTLPASFEGVLVANELLDAMPVHQVVMRANGLREVYVGAEGERLITSEGPPSTPAFGDYLDRLGVNLEPGWRVEINLRAVDWVREAARRLLRGFIILIDYGHEARELYSVTHAAGTLATFTRHTMAGAETAGAEPPWLRRPGEQDITAHVDFTSIRTAAEHEGLTALGFLDQTYFVMGLLDAAARGPAGAPGDERGGGAGARREWEGAAKPFDRLEHRLALKTLLMPGGLGSTLKVLILGKGVGAPALRGCSFRMRVT